MSRHLRVLAALCLAAALWPAAARSQETAPAAAGTPEDSLIAISADIVEISGSADTNIGFTWGPLSQVGISFAERAIPGIYRVGDFSRQTALQTTLKMLENESKAQILSNPKVITIAGEQANITVGSKLPFPVCSSQGCSAEFQDFGTILLITPVINPNKKDTIRAVFQLEVSNADFSKTVQVGTTAVPSKVTRQMQSTVEVKSGETLVIGGLKLSTKNVSKARVPYLGKIPVLGLLFTTSNVVENQQSLFLFITMEIVK